MPKIRIQLQGQPVTLPVPEGMDPHDYAAAVEARHLGQEQYTAESDSDLQNLRAGFGQGVVNVARNVGNIISDDIVSDEELARSKELDTDLLDTKAGMAGSFAGELATTLPLGGVGGAAAKGATAIGAKGLAKAAASTPGKMIAEGAATSYLLGDPENRAGSALSGAGISAAMGGAGKVLKKALTKPVVKKTAEALELESMTGKQIPLSHSAEPGVVRDVYESLVANIPGGSKALRGQYDNAVSDFREFIVEEASPPGFDRIIKPGEAMQDSIAKLQQVWDEAYDFTFKDAPIVLFDDIFKPPKIWNKLKPDGAPSLKSGMQVTGQDILSTKRDVQLAINNLGPEDYRKAETLTKFKNNLDDVLKDNLDPSGKGRSEWAGELKRYAELTPHYAKYQDVLSAAKKGEQAAANFTPKQLLKATSQRAGKGGPAGQGAFNKEAAVAAEVLTGFNNKPGIFQSVAALGFVGSLIGGTNVGAAAFGVPIALARGAASPKVQSALAGELPTQKMLANKLRQHKGHIYDGVNTLNRGVAVERSRND